MCSVEGLGPRLDVCVAWNGTEARRVCSVEGLGPRLDVCVAWKAWDRG